MQVMMNVEITPQQIADLMVTAIEGGITYWATSAKIMKNGVQVTYAEASSYEGGGWEFHIGYPEDDGDEVLLQCHFTEAQFAERITLAPQSLADLVGDNIDADSADVLIQCAAFGEVMFG